MFLGTLKTPPHCSLYDTRSFNYRNQLHCGLSTGNPATASSKCQFRCLLEISRLTSSLVSDDSRKGFEVRFCFFSFLYSYSNYVVFVKQCRLHVRVLIILYCTSILYSLCCSTTVIEIYIQYVITIL